MPINNFIVATEPLGAAGARALIRDDMAVADSRFVVNYFRLTPDHRLLFGGGESYGCRFPADIAGGGAAAAARGLSAARATRAITHAWGGTLAITTNRMPAFQRLGPGVFSAAGYSGHGLALATLAGKLMAEAVAGHGRALRRLRPPAAAGLPRRRPPALAAHGAGDELVRPARPAMTARPGRALRPRHPAPPQGAGAKSAVA